MTKPEIEQKIISSLSTLFDIDEQTIQSTSKLYEDLDLDSIDAVDLVVHLQKLTGEKINPEDFKSVRTVEDVVNAVDKMLN